MNDFLEDFRRGLRQFRTSPLFAFAAIVSLAIGVGTVTTVFAFANALLFAPIAGVDPGRLVRIVGTGPEGAVVSHSEYEELVLRTNAFESVLATRANGAAISVDGVPEDAWIQAVSPGFFPALGITLPLGGGLSHDPGATQTAVLSHAFWRRRFGNERSVIGSPLRINGHDFVIAGVAGPDFSGTLPGFDVDLWVSLSAQPLVLPRDGSLEDPDDRFLNLVARLGAGVTMAGANAQLASLTSDSEVSGVARGYLAVHATGVLPALKRLVSAFVGILAAILGLVLVTACVNVANLLLARGFMRETEIATRLATGARRSRIMRQLLAENLVLGLSGAALGLLGALAMMRVVSAASPPVGVPLHLELRPDIRVTTFAMSVGVVATLVFGLLPAVRASDQSPANALRSASSGRTKRGSWLQKVMVVVQVALATILVTGGALVTRSVLAADSIDPGFDRGMILTISADPSLMSNDEREVRSVWEQLSAEAASVPGIEKVGLGLFTHLGGRSDQGLIAPAESDPAEADGQPINYSLVDASYFEALGIPIAAGRVFDARDTQDSPTVAVPNQTLARAMWGSNLPLGRGLRVTVGGDGARAVEVVGVAVDVKYRRLNESPIPFLYLSTDQWFAPDLVLHVRTAGDPNALIPSLATRLRPTVPDLPLTIQRMDAEVSMTFLIHRTLGTVLSVTGTMGLLLAAIGVFGVTAYTVESRVPELGIRMALGAQASHVRFIVLKEGVTLTAIGLTIGLFAAVPASFALRGLLYGVGPTDPVAIAATLVVLIATAVIACYLPARRATRVDPLTVLRV